MGIKGQEKELWRALFSRTRRRVLGLLFGEPGRTFYANEIVRSVAAGTGSVQRELTRLADAGLLSVERIGNQVHYRANPDCLFFPELRSMAMKSDAVARHVRQVLDKIDGEVVAAVLYGADLREATGDDAAQRLLVVSPDLTRATLEAGLGGSGRQLRLVLLRPERFRALYEAGDSALLSLLAGPHVVIAGCLETR